MANMAAPGNPYAGQGATAQQTGGVSVVAPSSHLFGKFDTPLCCPGEAGCDVCMAAVFCPCCVVGANAKMMAHPGAPVGPCDGSGTECMIHGTLTAISAVVQISLQMLMVPFGQILNFGKGGRVQFARTPPHHAAEAAFTSFCFKPLTTTHPTVPVPV